MRSVIQAARGVAIEAYESWLTPSADLLSLPIQREVLADRYHVVENLMDWVSKEISRNQIPGRTIMIIIFQRSQIKGATLYKKRQLQRGLGDVSVPAPSSYASKTR